jgi:hypothetical protein
VKEIPWDMMVRDLISALDNAADEMRAVMAGNRKKLDRSDINALKRATKVIAGAAEHITDERYTWLEQQQREAKREPASRNEARGFYDHLISNIQTETFPDSIPRTTAARSTRTPGGWVS